MTVASSKEKVRLHTLSSKKYYQQLFTEQRCLPTPQIARSLVSPSSFIQCLLSSFLSKTLVGTKPLSITRYRLLAISGSC